MATLGYIPTSIICGESIWISAANTIQSGKDIILADYSPASGYTLAYQFASSTPLSVAAVANDDDSGWTLEVTGAQTLAWSPAVIAYAGIVTHTATGRTFSVDSGTITANASPLRVSSWVAVLATVDAAIASYASNPNGSFTVDGMSVSYRSMSDLIALRDYVSFRLSQDTASKSRRIIRTRFT